VTPLSPSCSSCPHRARPVPFDGPQPSRILFLGEGPAFTEVREGRPFAGKSGRELDRQYLPLAGLCRLNVRVGNVMSCALPGFANPDVDQARRCADALLPHEIRYTNPEIIVTLGAVACGVLFPDCDLSLEHGLPRPVTLPPPYSWSGIHVPIYHPAAGLHESEFMIPLQSDFTNLGLIQRGEFVMPTNPYPAPIYHLITTPQELHQAIEGDHQDSPRRSLQPRGEVSREVGVDTETLPLPRGAPWGLSFAFQPGTGYVILADRHNLLGEFARYIQGQHPLVVLHNALFDLDVLSRMGVTVERWTDTMQLSYILMDLPQGLKALAYRLCGMKMQSFEDLVLPYAREEVLAYLNSLSSKLKDVGWAPPSKPKLPPLPRKPKAIDGGWLFGDDPRMVVEKERARLLSKHAQAHSSFVEDPLTSAMKKLRRLIADMDKDPAANPWKRWNAWDDEERDALSNLAGAALPPPSIAQVPLPQAIHYSARDADATLRVLHALRIRARELRRKVA
jgi:uracil-DNA glycosylase family 4